MYKKYSRAQVRVVVGQGAKGGASTRRLQATHKVGAMLGGVQAETAGLSRTRIQTIVPVFGASSSSFGEQKAGNM